MEPRQYVINNNKIIKQNAELSRGKIWQVQRYEMKHITIMITLFFVFYNLAKIVFILIQKCTTWHQTIFKY